MSTKHANRNSRIHEREKLKMSNIVVRTGALCSKCHSVVVSLGKSDVDMTVIPLDVPENADELAKVREMLPGPYINLPVITYEGVTVDGSNMKAVMDIVRKAKADARKEAVAV